MDDMQESKADISSLLEVNRLDYRLPPSLSIATSRAMKIYRAHQSSYPTGQQLQFTLSSGSTYVDFLNSFLKFKVKMPNVSLANANPKFSPHAGWAQMIEQIRIVHSSGVEIDRMKSSVGEWMQLNSYYNKSEATRRTQGSLYSLNDTSRPSPLVHTNELVERAKAGLNRKLTAAPALGELVGDALEAKDGEAFSQAVNVQNKEFDVAIPLGELLGFFNVDLLAPSFLAAGLQIHIDMYPPQHFFVCGTDEAGVSQAPTATNVWPADAVLTINQPEFHLETFTLTDSILRKLSQISASSGLEWYFDAVHQMDASTSESDYSMQITRALSRANNVIVKSRTKTNIGNTNQDSYGSQAWVKPVDEGGGTSDGVVNGPDSGKDGSMIAFQVQLGAQYIPSRSMAQRKEFVHSAFKTYSQFRRSDEVGGVDDVQFSGYRVTRKTDAAATSDDYHLGLAISAVPLETSSTLQQSGAAISAQRTAVVNMTWKPTKGGLANSTRKLDCFVVYSKLATLFLDSVVVRS